MAWPDIPLADHIANAGKVIRRIAIALSIAHGTLMAVLLAHEALRVRRIVRACRAR